MTPRQLFRIVASLLVVVFAFPAAAAKQDAATLKRIDEALNVHYLAADYAKAEEVLQSAAKSCGTKFCSGEVLAKVYVAIGVIRGNAKQDLAGARTAFENAKAADPNATLDAALATPKVLAEFYKVMERELPPEATKPASTDAAEEPAAPEVKETGAPRVSPAGDLRCTPVSGYEIQTATPIAVVCEPLEGVVRAELYYRMAGEQEYQAILMSVVDGTLRAHIPCESLTKAGKLEVYIIAQDINKEMIDTFGNIVTPAHYMLVAKTAQPVPTYPGQPAPQRCMELLNGAGMAGQACSESALCRTGNYCADGICRKSPTCESDVDCESNSCDNGFCKMDEEFRDDKEPNRLMFGLHFGQDIWLAPSAKEICGNASILAGDYNCYNSGQDKIFEYNTETGGARSSSIPMTNPGVGNVSSGVRLATLRVLLSGDYALTRHLSVGGRLGWAFNGGPRTIKYVEGRPKQNKSFMPAHVEARGTLWVRSLSKPGLHPYIHLNFGVAEVDAKIKIKGSLDYTPVTDDAPHTPVPPERPGEKRELDAWRKMGLFFVGGGAGALYTFGKSRTHGAQLNVNLMYMLPSTGIIIEPTLGYVFSI